MNAINLDGGGSATFVVNGTVVNYPSDTWYAFLIFSTLHQLLDLCALRRGNYQAVPCLYFLSEDIS